MYGKPNVNKQASNMSSSSSSSSSAPAKRRRLMDAMSSINSAVSEVRRGKVAYGVVLDNASAVTKQSLNPNAKMKSYTTIEVSVMLWDPSGSGSTSYEFPADLKQGVKEDGGIVCSESEHVPLMSRIKVRVFNYNGKPLLSGDIVMMQDVSYDAYYWQGEWRLSFQAGALAKCGAASASDMVEAVKATPFDANDILVSVSAPQSQSPSGENGAITTTDLAAALVGASKCFLVEVANGSTYYHDLDIDEKMEEDAEYPGHPQYLLAVPPDNDSMHGKDPQTGSTWRAFTMRDAQGGKVSPMGFLLNRKPDGTVARSLLTLRTGKALGAFGIQDVECWKAVSRRLIRGLHGVVVCTPDRDGTMTANSMMDANRRSMYDLALAAFPRFIIDYQKTLAYVGAHVSIDWVAGYFRHLDSEGELGSGADIEHGDCAKTFLEAHLGFNDDENPFTLAHKQKRDVPVVNLNEMNGRLASFALGWNFYVVLADTSEGAGNTDVMHSPDFFAVTDDLVASEELLKECDLKNSVVFAVPV